MEYNVNKIGERIKTRRTECGLTQNTLADKAFINPKSIIDLEHGNSFPRIETLALLANALDCEIGYLLGEYEQPTKAATDVLKATKLSPEAVKILMEDLHEDSTPFISLFIEHSHDIIKAIEEELKLASMEKAWKKCPDYSVVKKCFKHGETNSRKKGRVVGVYYGDTSNQIIADAEGLYYQYDYEEGWSIGYYQDGTRNEENLRRVLSYMLEVAKKPERYFTLQETFLEVVKEYIKKEMERREGMKAKVVLYEDETRNEVWVNMERGTELHQLRITAFYTKDKEETVEETVVAELIKREYIKKANEVEFCKANAERIV